MSSLSPEPSPTYLQLRSRLLSLKPAELGLSPSPAAPHVWGVLIDMGFEAGIATLVCLADGTTSLHYSTGGGLLGRGDYDPVAQASKALVSMAETVLQHTTRAEELPLPQPGQVRFILLTYAGMLAADASEKSLVSGENPLSLLYQNAQATLGQLRAASEKRSK